jgi:putative inorganic carbon (hco3(-)) transporter
MNTLRTAAVALLPLELWVVALAVGGSVAITRMLPVAVLVAACFWLVRLVAWGRLSVRTPLDWLVALLAALIPVTLVVTPVPVETRTQVLRLLCGIALFYAVANWATTLGRLRLLLGATIVVAAASAALTPLVVAGAPDKFWLLPSALYPRRPSLVDEAINFNVMAGMLVLLLPVPLAASAFGGPPMPRALRTGAAVAAAVVAAIIVWTQSRGALIAMAAIVACMVGLRWRRGWLVCAVVAAGGVALLALGGGAPALNPLALEGPQASIGDRMEIWRRAVGMIGDFPITGVGLGAFGDVANVLYPFYVLPPPFPHAHNLFLQVAVDFGLPGLAVWLAIVGVVARCAWRVRQHGCRTGDAFAVVYGAAMLGSLTGLLVHGLLDAVTWGMVRPAVVVWGMWGLAIASYRCFRGAAVPVPAVTPTLRHSTERRSSDPLGGRAHSDESPPRPSARA